MQKLCLFFLLLLGSVKWWWGPLNKFNIYFNGSGPPGAKKSQNSSRKKKFQGDYAALDETDRSDDSQDEIFVKK